MKKKSLKRITAVLLLSVTLVSCVRIDLYEKQVSMPLQQWYYNNTPTFTFRITDTSSLYNVYIVLRHTDAYDYNNIWLRLGSRAPGDTLQLQNINLQLGSDARGWEGAGTGDIYEVRKSITPGPIPFKKTGDYTFTLTQIMRENPLKHILNVGIRVEKVNHQ